MELTTMIFYKNKLIRKKKFFHYIDFIKSIIYLFIFAIAIKTNIF